MKLIKTTKIGRVGNNNSNFGESKEFHVGYFIKEPIVGENFKTQGYSFEHEGIRTSVVTKIIDKNTFETKNSVYKWEEYKL